MVILGAMRKLKLHRHILQHVSETCLFSYTCRDQMRESRYWGSLTLQKLLLPTSFEFFDALCLGCRARVCGACGDDQEIVWNSVTRDSHHLRIRHRLSWTLHQFCLLQVLRMLDDCALRKFWLHSVPQGRVRYFEIVLSALKAWPKKATQKQVCQERQIYCSFWLSQHNIGWSSETIFSNRAWTIFQWCNWSSNCTGKDSQSFTSVTLWGPRCI